MNHHITNSLLTNMLFGLRPLSSPQEVLISLVTNWHRYLDKSLLLELYCLTSLLEAFDTVPHSGLVSVLCRVGISGPLFSWLADNFSNRSQHVVLNRNSSQPSRCTSGVPQSSILGRLLFSIYID